MKLREQAMIKVEPQVLIPTSSRPAMQRYPWKMSIVTTVFWVGEEAGGNNPVPNYKSCWDLNWTANYGEYGQPGAERTPQLHSNSLRSEGRIRSISRSRITM